MIPCLNFEMFNQNETFKHIYPIILIHEASQDKELLVVREDQRNQNIN